jgi:phage terminase large subunit
VAEIRLQIPKALQPFATEKKRFKVALGGRGSGKSTTLAKLCVIDAMRGIKTACFREYQNSLDDSVYSLICTIIKDLGLDDFEIQKNTILYKGEEAFKFKGLARNPSAVQSFHGFSRFWIEEAQTISADSLKALTPTLRAPGAELWCSANPQSLKDEFSQRFFAPFEKELRTNKIYKDDMHLIVWSNWTDNPWFMEAGGLNEERLWDKEHKSSALYKHIWEGETYDEVEHSIIPVEWFEAAVDAHKKLGFKAEGAVVCTHDPSDNGDDAKGYAARRGVVFEDICEMATGDVNVGCDWALDKAIAIGADYFGWDADGMGVTLKRQVDHSLTNKKIEWFMFKGSEAPQDAMREYDPVDIRDPAKRKTNREALLNRRAQAYMELARRFHNTYRAVNGEYIDPDELISLDSDKIAHLDAVRAEVCRVPLKPNSSGKIQIASKTEMARMGIPSPNMADCMMMSLGFTPKIKTELKPIKFAGWK